MNERAPHPCLLVVQQALDGMSRMLGKHYEVILHDLRHPDSSIMDIKGDVTHRKPGGPITNYVLQMLRKYGDDAPDSINYKNVISDGRVLRSSTIFIRDEQQKIVGCLCINQDLTDFISAANLTQSLVALEAEQDENPGVKEYFARDIGDMMETMVDDELRSIQKPVPLMMKEDKLLLVHHLEEKGIFDVKGSVEYVAERLGVTSFTIYNYLKEVRFSRNGSSGNGRA